MKNYWVLEALLGIFALPIAISWVIMKRRQRREGSDDQDYGGPYDESKLNPYTPLPLRQFTVTGETDFDNPPAGYNDAIPRD